jgi:hypothetical protein
MEYFVVHSSEGIQGAQSPLFLLEKRDLPRHILLDVEFHDQGPAPPFLPS